MNLHDHELEYAQTKGHDSLTHARATLERALRELDRYIERYDEGKDAKDRADVLNWSINHLVTFIPNNIRLDLIAGAQAEMLRAHALQQQAKAA